jgi:two-component system CheB/CheR fusion protein
MCDAEGKGQHYAISAAGVWVDCVRARAPVIHNDYAGLAHKKGLPEGHARVTRELLVPVMREGRVTQIMGVGNKATDYVQADVDAVQTLAAMVQDITERWRATSALRESENNYHTLADFSPALIWASGTDRAFNYVNQPWLSFTGRSLEQESGNGWAEGVHPEDFQRLIAAYTEAFGRRASFSLEWRLRRHDGEFRWLRNDGCARHDPNGKFIGYLGYCMDITESKAFEHSLIAARVAAESANRVKSEFLANMSHEFRTPLNGILGNAQLLQMSNLGAEEKAYLSDLIASGKKLLSLTNDILDMSKIEAAAMELEQGEFSLRGCVDELMRAHRPRGAGKGPMLKVQIPYEVPDALLGDKVRLKQILNNLLGNAIKFTEEGSITLVAALKERDGGNAIIEICVIDTGIGIAEAAVREIFKPFVQADGSTSRRYGGSGLGLTIAQRLAELMGGSISVQSAEGVGSTFRVLLPFSLAGAA